MEEAHRKFRMDIRTAWLEMVVGEAAEDEGDSRVEGGDEGAQRLAKWPLCRMCEDATEVSFLTYGVMPHRIISALAEGWGRRA